MDNSELITPNNILFCEKRWKLLSVFLSVITFGTFLWGFVILVNYLEEYDFEDYAINGMAGGMSGMINTVAGETQLQQLVAPSVVTVIAMGQQGQSFATSSGVIVNPDGYVLTSLHAIAGKRRVAIQVITDNGPRQYRAEVIKIHQPHDLALLKIITTDRFLFLRIADSQTLRGNVPIMTVGRDANGATLATTGLLRHHNQQVRVGKLTMSSLLQSDAPVTWQQSGGAMVNEKAELVGLNLIINNSRGTQSYAIPSQVIQSHFQDVIHFTGPAGQPGTTQVNDPAAASGLGKLAASWWGRARDLQLLQNQNSGIPPTTANSTFTNLGVNIAAPAVEQILPQNTGTDSTSNQNRSNSTTPSPTPIADNPQVNHIGSAGDMVTLSDLENETGFNIGGYKLDAMFGLAILGLFGGIVGALMPMGGSLVVVTGMMMFFTYGLFLIRPAIYVTNLFTYGIPAYRFLQKGLTMRDRVYPLFTWVVLGVLIGYFAGLNMPDHFVGYLLGVFALALAGVALNDLREPEEPEEVVTAVKPKNKTEALNSFLNSVKIERKNEPKTNTLQTALMGAPLGLLTGLIGVSGGLIEIFYQRKIDNISFSNALANASVMVFVASLTGAVVSFIYGTSINAFSWQTPLTLAMILVPSAFAGGVLGYRLCSHLTKQQQRYGFTAVMLAIALTMFFAQ